MQLDLAEQILDLLAAARIPSLTIIGGEPTCHPDFMRIISLCKGRIPSVGVVTNGIKFAEEGFLDKCISAGLTSVGLSLKGNSAQDFYATTGSEQFETVMQAIYNLSNRRFPFSVSLVISRDNIDTFLQGIQAAKDRGARHFRLSICYDFSALYGTVSTFDLEKDVFQVIRGFCKNYKELNSITEGQFVLHQTLPMCIWPEKMIAELANKKQIVSSCQLLRHSGLIFDPKGFLLPCNAMYNTQIGKFGVDFQTPEELFSFWKSPKIMGIYSRLSSVPDEDCLTCDLWSKCGGGCISNWFNYFLRDYKQHLYHNHSLNGWFD